MPSESEKANTSSMFLLCAASITPLTKLTNARHEPSITHLMESSLLGCMATQFVAFFATMAPRLAKTGPIPTTNGHEPRIREFVAEGYSDAKISTLLAEEGISVSEYSVFRFRKRNGIRSRQPTNRLDSTLKAAVLKMARDGKSQAAIAKELTSSGSPISPRSVWEILRRAGHTRPGGSIRTAAVVGSICKLGRSRGLSTERIRQRLLAGGHRISYGTVYSILRDVGLR